MTGPKICPECGLSDDPDLDATDFAHPAWWRGNDQGVIVLCKMINEILDGKKVLGESREPWGSTRRRIAAMRDRLERLRANFLDECFTIGMDEDDARALLGEVEDGTE